MMIWVLLVLVVQSREQEGARRWRLPLAREYQCLAVLAGGDPQVVLGRHDGAIDLVNLRDLSISPLESKLRQPIRQLLSGYYPGEYFAHDRQTAVQGRVANRTQQTWRPKDPIRGLAISKNSSGERFLATVHSEGVVEVVLGQEGDGSTLVYAGFQVGAEEALFSPGHSHLYLVNRNREQLVVFEVGGDGRRSQIVLERKFSFRIRQLLTDDKDVGGQPQVLVMVTEEGSVFVGHRGAITTFLPFKNSTVDQLLGASFCEDDNFMTLHLHHTASGHLIYLSFFDKRTHLLLEARELTSLFGQLQTPLALDCNSQHIAILTSKELLILERPFYRTPTETPAPSPPTPLSHLILLVALPAVLLLLCCPKNRPQGGSEEKVGEGEDKSEEGEGSSSVEGDSGGSRGRRKGLGGKRKSS